MTKLEKAELDQFDVELLRQMQLDCQQSSTALSAKIALSPTAIQRRLKRLRNEGYIRSEHAILEPTKLGSFLQLLVMLRLKKGGREINSAVLSRLDGLAQVQQCYAVTGEYDFVLMMVVRDMAEYDALCKRIFQAHDDVERYETTVIMESVKQSFALPLSLN